MRKCNSSKNFTLKSGRVVCQKHFTWDDIVWKKEVKDPDGNFMGSVMASIMALKNNKL